MEMKAVYDCSKGFKDGSGQPDWIEVKNEKYNENYIPESSARKSARILATVMLSSGMLFGGLGLGVGASYKMAEKEAAQNPLELTCEQLSQKDTSVRGTDGKVYTLNCDKYGNPVLQEGRK